MNTKACVIPSCSHIFTTFPFHLNHVISYLHIVSCLISLNKMTLRFFPNRYSLMGRYLFAYGTIKLNHINVGSLDMCFPLIIYGAPNIKLPIKSKLYRYNVMILKYQKMVPTEDFTNGFYIQIQVFFLVLGNGFWGFKYLMKTNQRKKKQHFSF